MNESIKNHDNGGDSFILDTFWNYFPAGIWTEVVFTDSRNDQTDGGESLPERADENDSQCNTSASDGENEVAAGDGKKRSEKKKKLSSASKTPWYRRLFGNGTDRKDHGKRESHAPFKVKCMPIRYKRKFEFYNILTVSDACFLLSTLPPKILLRYNEWKILFGGFLVWSRLIDFPNGYSVCHSDITLSLLWVLFIFSNFRFLNAIFELSRRVNLCNRFNFSKSGRILKLLSYVICE